ncbi:MAG: murein L,D-transpeptidase [Myxococcales bacterium]|nr:murein L,D-transpeptidase [Myxococcales bacterium]
MPRALVLVSFLVAIACAEGGSRVATQPPPPPTGEIPAKLRPTHPRALAAAARVGPVLITELEGRGLRLGDPIFLRALKRERVVEVFVRQRATGTFELFRTYPIAAASGELGPKQAEGDWQVPEGFYQVGRRAMHPGSAYHLAFNLGYPNAYDRSHGRTGSAIMMHGNQVSIGCLAMTDAKIEEIYTLAEAALRGGQVAFAVHVFPFRMTTRELAYAAAEESPWHSFWLNLKEGYDWFETTKRPPRATVVKGAYAFAPSP